MNLPERVVIREVGPREGFQTHSEIVPTPRKIELIHALNATGVSEIEVASFVRPDRVPQMADAAEVVRLIDHVDGVKYHGLYLNQKGFELAEKTGRLNNRCWLYTATSESFLKRNSNTTHQQLIEDIPGWLKLFKSFGKELHGLMMSMSFGNASEGVISADTLLDLVIQYMKAIEDAGGSLVELSLADTVGYGNPETVRSCIRKIRECFPSIELSLHLHDTCGTGLANAYAGLLEGVTCFESSVGGMGGCPFARGAAGNIATEDLVNMFHHMGIETGIDLEAYKGAALLAEEIIGATLSGHVYKVQKK